MEECAMGKLMLALLVAFGLTFSVAGCEKKEESKVGTLEEMAEDKAAEAEDAAKDAEDEAEDAKDAARDLLD